MKQINKFYLMMTLAYTLGIATGATMVYGLCENPFAKETQKDFIVSSGIETIIENKYK